MTESVARIIYFSFFGLAGITLLVGIDVIDRTPGNSFGLFIAFISVSLFLYAIGWISRYLIGGSGSFGSKLNTLKIQTFRKWGMLFRTLFISSIGIIVYFWLDPQPIGDTPFAELTLNHVFRNLFAFLIASGCFCWFLKFPVQEDPKWPNDNPYDSWGWFGVLVILIVSAIVFLFAAWA